MNMPDSKLHKSIKSAIHPNWHLACSSATPDQPDENITGKTVWHLTEPDTDPRLHNLLTIHARDSIAFSLDQKGKTPFPFLGTALAGMHTVADGIVVTTHEGHDYIIIIELKTTPNLRSKNKAIQQIHASARLMEWLCKTLVALEHWAGEPTVIGVISYKPREIPRRVGTAREMPKAVDDAGIAVFELSNQVLDVPMMLAALTAASDADGALS